jgi:hypothetical protein
MWVSAAAGDGVSGCGCTGYYHNGGCSDQNVVWWHGVPGGQIPVNPTDEEISAQRARNIARGAGAAMARIRELEKALLAAKIPHHHCEDCWYSCPMSDEGCCDEREIGCNCGAEKHNAAIDAALEHR